MQMHVDTHTQIHTSYAKVRLQAFIVCDTSVTPERLKKKERTSIVYSPMLLLPLCIQISVYSPGALQLEAQQPQTGILSHPA